MASPLARLDASLASASATGKFDVRALKSAVKAVAMSVKQTKGEEETFSRRRTLLWRLLLHVLPAGAARSVQRELAKKREQYTEFLREFKQLPVRGEAAHDADAQSAARHANAKQTGGQGAAHEVAMVTVSDPLSHPLCSGDSKSEWMEYFKDNELKEQIDKDVDRTHPDIAFFSTCGDGGAASVTVKSGSSAYHFNEWKTAMRRMLFVYAKLNPGLKYVQGMNELLAPILYCYASHSKETKSSMEGEDDDAAGFFVDYNEADTFFSLVDLLSEFRDYYCKQLDNSSVGIKATLRQLSMRLRQCDERLWAHIEGDLRIEPQFYAFRWITLVFTQEYDFDDTLVLWDYLFADDRGRIECIIDISVAMLLLVRERLLAGDFAANLKLLQKYPTKSVRVQRVMRLAERLASPIEADFVSAVATIRAAPLTDVSSDSGADRDVAEEQPRSAAPFAPYIPNTTTRMATPSVWPR